MKIFLKNETNYNSVDLKKILLRAAKEVGCRENKEVTVKYPREGQGRRGYAWLGRRDCEARCSVLYIPKTNPDPVIFARVARHEFMHNLGVRHKDMTEEQRYSLAGGEWADAIGIRERTPPPKKECAKVSPAKKRENTARAMLKRTDNRIAKLKRQLALAEKKRRTWARKVKYYDKKALSAQ